MTHDNILHVNHFGAAYRMLLGELAVACTIIIVIIIYYDYCCFFTVN